MIVNLVTSVPLAPPWDQGDKNQAYHLTRALPHIHFQVLTNRNSAPPQGANLELLPLYSALTTLPLAESRLAAAPGRCIIRVHSAARCGFVPPLFSTHPIGCASAG